MGYILNHTIIVTGSYGDHVSRAHTKAVEIFGQHVSAVIPGTANGAESFFIPPDGSKEGWDESDNGDKRRAEFIEWLKAQAYGDASSPLGWVELTFGGDDGGANIVQASP